MRLKTFLLCSSLFIASCADVRSNPGDPRPLLLEDTYAVWAEEPYPNTYGGPLSPFYWPAADELDLMAITLWGEARSQGDEEIRAIANVMINRAERSNTGRLETILLQPFQFSVWNKGDANYKGVWNLRRQGCKINNRCLELREIALEVLMMRFYGTPGVDLTEGATYYHHGSRLPVWAARMDSSEKIGMATFYRGRF